MAECNLTAILFLCRDEVMDKVPADKMKALCEDMADNPHLHLQMSAMEVNDLIRMCLNVSRFS